VQRGATLRYRVTLTNPTNAPIHLDTCPAFAQTLTSGNGDMQAPLTYLNCDAIRSTIPAHRSVIFSMRFAIPEDFPTGRWTVRWLITFPTTGPADSAPIVVND
jgi:hypothetical protein